MKNNENRKSSLGMSGKDRESYYEKRFIQASREVGYLKHQLKSRPVKKVLVGKSDAALRREVCNLRSQISHLKKSRDAARSVVKALRTHIDTIYDECKRKSASIIREAELEEQ